MAEDLIDPGGIRHHRQIVDLGGFHIMQYPLFLDDGLEQFSYLYRLGGFLPGFVMLRQAFQQTIHFIG